jgi:chloride channel protein, CIC family
MLCPFMAIHLSEPGGRIRILSTRLLRRLGLSDEAFLLVLAVVIGVVTGVAAVFFHELINFIRDSLYRGFGPEFLYSYRGMGFLLLFPTLGGLAVGLISRYLFRTREGHGVVDVVESVVRSSGFQKPSIAIEKILTSAITIGTGGSAGAEGPIVQIGAAIASGVGQAFRVARAQMPILTGCGCAAGISAIFNAPFGGVLFTMEVILQDFSIRYLTPVVLASVIAQVSVQATYQVMHNADSYRAIFAMPAMDVVKQATLNWGQVGNFVLLGIICGMIGANFTRTMYWTEHSFSLIKVPKVIRPALGGALLGLAGMLYIVLFGHLLLDVQNHKPFSFDAYPMPAFYGDGYGVIQQMLTPMFYTTVNSTMVLLLVFLVAVKILGTCVTLGSGGSGGVIAPCVFIGAATGAVVGHLLQLSHWFPHLQPELYALVAMGAVLAAVVHAPLASILIVFELTQDYKVMLPAMLACIVSVAVARIIYADSVYTLSLRMRGVSVGTASDLVLLRRINVEQVSLEPVTFVRESDPVERLLQLGEMTDSYDFVVTHADGTYAGMVLSDDLNPVLMDRSAAPVLVVRDVMRNDIVPVRTSDNLANVLDAFSQHDVSHLPVGTAANADKVMGLISRSALLRKYQATLKGG